jgi:hypothetical protein
MRALEYIGVNNGRKKSGREQTEDVSDNFG